MDFYPAYIQIKDKQLKKLSLILILLMLLISCSKIQEKKRIEIKSNNRFRMKAFTPEDIPRFNYLHIKRPVYEKKNKKIKSAIFSFENVGDGAVYMKNNFIYITGSYNERIKKTRKFDLIIKKNRIELRKISEWKQNKLEKQIEIDFFKQLDNQKILAYFLNIADEKIAQFIPEGVAIRFYKKLDFNRDGKPDYFIIFSYPIYYTNNFVNEEIMLYIILFHKNGYTLQLKSWMGESFFSFIVDVNAYKNKYLFISKINPSRTGAEGFFELYWYE